jgi:predicted RNA-binding protein with PUA-like domain
MQYWLMKSEPTEYSIDDLKRDGRSSWFGVRNYLARNYMRDQMQIGDRILFYHSSCETPGIAGIAEVVSSPHADMTQYDPQSKYYDPKATIENPRWYCVDVGYIAHLDRGLTIRELRDIP